MIDVVCAVIINSEGEILLAQRSEKMSMPLKWEFPGGKIELGETAQQALKREIKEELDLDIRTVLPLSPCIYHYSSISIKLIPFLCQFVSGELKLKEHKSFVWTTIDQFKQFDWAEADLPVVDELYRKLGSGCEVSAAAISRALSSDQVIA